jgi:hypothetical protein
MHNSVITVAFENVFSQENTLKKIFLKSAHKKTPIKIQFALN